MSTFNPITDDNMKTSPCYSLALFSLLSACGLATVNAQNIVWDTSTDTHTQIPLTTLAHPSSPLPTLGAIHVRSVDPHVSKSSPVRQLVRSLRGSRGAALVSECLKRHLRWVLCSFRGDVSHVFRSNHRLSLPHGGGRLLRPLGSAGTKWGGSERQLRGSFRSAATNVCVWPAAA